MHKSPSSWEELGTLAEVTIIEARSRLETAIHERERDRYRQVKKRIERYKSKGVVLPCEGQLPEIEKQLDGRKYPIARRSIASVDNELKKTLSLFNRVTFALKEIRELRDDIALRGIRTDEGEIERLDGKYGKGEYESLLKIISGVKRRMNAELEKHIRIKGELDRSSHELEKIKHDMNVAEIEEIVVLAQQALLRGEFGESERIHEKARTLLDRRKEEIRNRWQPVEGNFRYLVPNYTITHKTGSGGSAIVYKGIDRDGKPVAIKLPKFLDETLDVAIYDKFESEARIWENLRHGNIVEFREYLMDPVPCLVMELMEGGNLKDRLKSGKLTVREELDIFLQLIDAISYAHRMGTIHRDIKPENILFTRDGVPKLTDWGIGKFMASLTETTVDGKKGTLAYSAPEQASPGKFGKIDWSTDIFQLGIVMYEMLTGRNPFMDDDPAGIVTNILYETVRPPSSINPDISPSLDNLVMKALEKQKDRRWRSADVMYHELKKFSELQ